MELKNFDDFLQTNFNNENKNQNQNQNQNISDNEFTNETKDEKILNLLNEKNIAISTYRISDKIGLDVENITETLQNLNKDEKIKNIKIGEDDYWEINL